MKRASLALVAFVLLSCTKYVELKLKKGSFSFKPDNLTISKVKVEDWRVGPRRKQRLSKGIRVEITFPQISNKDLEVLYAKKGVDSWLLKVRKKSYTVNSVLGYIYIPLITPGTQGKSKYRRHQIKKGGFSIYYSAAALSKRFERLACPAFEHDRYIKKVEILPTHRNLSKIYGSSLEEAYIAASVVEFNYAGNILNGGKSILGEFSVEVALYNRSNKMRKTGFVELIQTVKVSDERRKQVQGCQGSVVPPKGPVVNERELFKWSR